MSLTLCCSASLSDSIGGNYRSNQWRQRIRSLVETVGVPSQLTLPDESLRRGNWVKLICGASFEDVADIRNLSLVYSLAGVDCIDCAADSSVLNAVNEGIEVAREISPLRRPWIMISVNDHEDPHFRKAEFDPDDCPVDCSRPCERVCPANAISFENTSREQHPSVNARKFGTFQRGVITERCYGCGRCFPMCPFDKIKSVTYIRDVAATSQLLVRYDVDAIEIHTSARQVDTFERLWKGLANSVGHLKLVAVSLPDLGDITLASMDRIYSIMDPHLQCYNLWQLDGRPMSGDIGRGANRETISFAVRMAGVNHRPPGFLQLAGGTNSHTIDYLKNMGLFQKTNKPHSSGKINAKFLYPQALIGGIAYGGYARKIIGRILRKIPSSKQGHIEDYPEYLFEALNEALSLVGPIKSFNLSSSRT